MRPAPLDLSLCIIVACRYLSAWPPVRRTPGRPEEGLVRLASIACAAPIAILVLDGCAGTSTRSSPTGPVVATASGEATKRAVEPTSTLASGSPASAAPLAAVD